jgi:hypothetical protein
MLMELASTAASMFGSGDSGSGLSGLTGGGGSSDKSAAQAGDFYGGSLNTNANDMYKLAIIAGVILLYFIIRRKR